MIVWVQDMLNLLPWICRDMHSLLPWIWDMLSLLPWFQDMPNLLPWVSGYAEFTAMDSDLLPWGSGYAEFTAMGSAYAEFTSLLSSVWLHMQAPAKQTTAEKNLAKINRTGIKPLSSFFKKKQAKGT